MTWARKKSTLIFISLVWLGVLAANDSRATCEALVRRSVANAARIRIEGVARPIIVPLGIDPIAFKKFSEQMLSIEGADAIIVFGSRTHFTYGLPPLKNSDLDVVLFFHQPVSEGQKLKAREYAKALEVEVGFKVTLPLENWAANLAVGMEASEATFRFPLSAASEEAIMNDVIADSKTWYFKSHDRVKEAIDKARSIHANGYEKLKFNKEALIIVKPSLDAPKTLHKLREFGFSNLYYAKA